MQDKITKVFIFNTLISQAGETGAPGVHIICNKGGKRPK